MTTSPEALRRIVAEGREIKKRYCRMRPVSGSIAQFFCRHGDLLLSALESCALSPQQAQWQSIETAPRSGAVLVASDDGSIFLARQTPNGKWFNGDVILEDMEINVTYWQPLPTPPSEPKT